MPKRRRVALMLDLQWPYKHHTGIFAGTQQYAQEHDWESVIDEFAGDTLASGRNGRARYDGIIARANTHLVDQAKKRNVPVANVWASSPVKDQLPGVFPDSRLAGRLRAEHLLSRGFDNLAALICRRETLQEEELKGFLGVATSAGLRYTVTKVALSYSRDAATWRRTLQSLGEWMDLWRLPIGVFVAPDTLGRMTAQMCLDRGWRVPEDVAIIAGRNEEVFCEHPEPSLTSIEYGYERIGYEAARLLDQLMKRKKPRRSTKRPPSPRHIFLAPQAVVVRASTDFYAVDDPVVGEALEFIAAHSHRDIGPDDVAQAVATEKRTLQRYFRKHLDRPIATEIRRVRIERAKRQLAQSDASMQQIARDVGFGEAMRMYEVFRRELGVTPTKYREQRRIRADGSE